MSALLSPTPKGQVLAYVEDQRFDPHTSSTDKKEFTHDHQTLPYQYCSGGAEQARIDVLALGIEDADQLKVTRYGILLQKKASSVGDLHVARVLTVRESSVFKACILLSE